MNLFIPKNYDPKLDIRNTEVAIKLIKDNFEKELAKELNLTRVSAPLFVFPETGLNDNLSGTERAVKFGIKELDEKEVEIVHSLAKWKRFALKSYGFNQNEGLYTDMNAIRRDEDLDNLHSIYVDQWDWEIVIDQSQRNIAFLKETVNKIYNALKKVEAIATKSFPNLETFLPDEITFITTKELEQKYPTLSPKEREDEICKKHKAVFLMQIGGKLELSEKHDNRAPDYDDWQLNGDILLYYPILGHALEISSMGIRVDEKTLLSQLKEANELKRTELPFHKSIIEKKLPYTIGGGLGQSRICMFLLNKAHVGEVQVGIWPNEMIEKCLDNDIHLL